MSKFGGYTSNPSKVMRSSSTPWAYQPPPLPPTLVGLKALVKDESKEKGLETRLYGSQIISKTISTQKNNQ